MLVVSGVKRRRKGEKGTKSLGFSQHHSFNVNF